MFIRQQQINRPNHTFKDWLKSPIETINGLVYDVERESYKPLTHRDFVNSVYADIIGIINKNGHTITYKKASIQTVLNLNNGTFLTSDEMIIGNTKEQLLITSNR